MPINPLDAVNTGINAVGALGNLFGIGQKRQIKQQEKLNRLQIDGQKELGEFNQKQSMEMMRQQYGEQMKGMKDAGLNPALIYGGAGAGGQSTAGSAGSVTGAVAEAPSKMTEGMQGMGLQLQQMKMLQAQEENVKANTEKTIAEKNKLEGVDTEKAGAETGLINIQKQMEEVKVRIANATEYDAMSIIENTASKLMHEANIAGTNQVINENTRVEQENKIKAEAIGAMLENQAKRQGIQLDQARITEIIAGIEQKWKSLELESKGQTISVENMKRLTETMLWSAGINATGNIVNSIIDVKKMGMGKRMDRANRNGRTETDRFDSDGNHTGSTVTRTY